MSKKRTRKVALVLVGILLPLGTFGLGYFFKQDSIPTKKLGNTLVVDGEISGTLKDDALDTTGLVPGDSINKTIEINPNCTAPSLLRVKVNPYWSDSENDSSNIITKFNIKYSSELNSDKNEPYWYKDNDGYLYYIGIIDENISNIDLVNGFALDTGDNVNEYQGKNIKVEVGLDVIQAKHNAYEQKWGVTNKELKVKLNELCESISKTQ